MDKFEHLYGQPQPPLPASSAVDDPLQRLNPLERLLCGALVRRALRARRGRVQRWLDSSGPYRTARTLCIEIFNSYAIATGVPGAFIRIVAPALGDALIAVAVVFVSLAIVSIATLSRLPKEQGSG